MERVELEGDWFIMAVEQSLLIGIFDDRATAENAIAQLRSAGFNNDQILYSSKASAENGGFMESLKNFFTGEQSSSSSQVASDLSAMGLSNDEANYYAREYQAGHSIVAIHPRERYREAVEILRNNGAYNGYQSERSNVQGTGYSQAAGTPPTPGYEQTTANYAQAAGTAPVPPYDRPGVEQEGDEVRRLKLREERLGVEKERVQSGEVRLRKEVVEEQKNIQVPVTHEEVVIERHPVSEGRVSDTPVGQDEVIRIPVSEEQVNVTKTTVETGEVGIGKRKVQESQAISETVRRERARLEEEGRPDIRSNLDRDDITDIGPTP
jgi:uncharacterized protein (TIGR02271 family)